MVFKRMEGFVGSIPQKFIDNRVPKCPMCGTTTPHWAIDMKISGFYNRYLFKCEQCNCILSSTVVDIDGWHNNPLSVFGWSKMLGGKKISGIYIKIDDVGSVQTTKIYEGKEIILDELNAMAMKL